jgi:predicted glycosyltransferase
MREPVALLRDNQRRFAPVAYGEGEMSLRVAFYSHNGFGLGHVSRNATLAASLLGRRPNADVLLITGSAALHEFPLPPNIDYVKLPSVRKQATGRWRPQALDIEMEHLIGLRRTIILEAVRSYRPHLFVADFLPLGVDGELIATLEELGDRSDARTVIGFRDLLEDPAVVAQTWDVDGTREALGELYDLVLVYGEPAWFDFEQYGLPADLPRYVGLLGDPEATPIRPRTTVRLLATSGGGADGYPVLSAALEAVPLLDARVEGGVRCTALTGPLMPDPDVERLRGIGKRVGGRVHRFADDLQSKLARSSVIVGMAGYNTVCEVLSYRTPAVVVPRPGPSTEQTMRARILGQRGLAAVLPLAECTGQAVADAVEPLVEGDGYPEDAVPNLGGIAAATDALLELLE